MQQKRPQTRWRRVAKDPAFRYALVLALLFAMPAAFAERHLVPLVLKGTSVVWEELGPFGIVGVAVGLVWFLDICAWGLSNAERNRGTRNPLWVLAYGLGGWAYVLLSTIFGSAARLFGILRDVLDEYRFRRGYTSRGSDAAPA